MIAVVDKHLQVRIAQGSTGLAAKVDHPQWQLPASAQAGGSSDPAITVARKDIFATSVRTYTRRSKSF